MIAGSMVSPTLAAKVRTISSAVVARATRAANLTNDDPAPAAEAEGIGLQRLGPTLTAADRLHNRLDHLALH